jgi:hypothetical protein
MLGSLITSLSKNVTEGFEGKQKNNNSKVSFLVSLISFIIIILLLAFLGKFLWNEIVAGNGNGVGIITIAKPIDSIYQILGLYILLSLLLSV